MNRRTRILFGALPVAAIGIACLARQEPDLLARSTCLTPFDPTYSMPVWTSDDTLVFQSPERRGHSPNRILTIDGERVQISLYSPKMAKDTVSRLDSDTKSRAKKLLRDGDGALPPTVAANGLIIYEYYQTSFRAAIRDSSTGEWIFCIKPPISDVLPLGMDLTADEVNEAPKGYKYVRLAGWTQRPAQLLLANIKDVVELTSVQVSNKKPIVSKRSIRPCDFAVIEDISVSQDGQQLAWIVQREERPIAFVRWLGEHTAFVNTEPNHYHELAITNLEGRNWRAIGRKRSHINKMEFYASTVCRDRPDWLMWRPDGHYVSFNHKGAVWMTKVD